MLLLMFCCTVAVQFIVSVEVVSVFVGVVGFCKHHIVDFRRRVIG